MGEWRTTMATVFKEPVNAAHLMDSNRSVRSEANGPSSDTVHRNRSTVVIFKSIELFMTMISLWKINDKEELTLDTSIKFIFAILGALIILPLFMMAGLIVGEVSPRLLVWLNRLGTVFFSAVAILLFYDHRFGGSSVFFSTLMAAIWYAIDAHVSSTMLPVIEVRRRHTRYTHG